MAKGKKINGTNGNDTLNGTAGDDDIRGLHGNDIINGLGGNDRITVRNGNNLIFGGAGNDNIDAGNGNNTIHGDGGDDTIKAGKGNDLLTGGDGNDTIDAGNGNNVVDAGGGNNTIKTGSGADTINAGDGINRIDAGSGNNTIRAGGNSGGGQTIKAGGGDDVISTGGGRDWIDAGNGNNRIGAGSGDDTIKAGNGDDDIFGGGGSNTIDAGNGNNIIETAGGGNDRVKSGNGNDRITLEYGNDTIDAGNGNNVIDAGSGNNTIKTGNGQDAVVAGGGNDTINTGGGNDTVGGGTGNDNLSAGGGDDVIFGDEGNDTIAAGNGDDVLFYALSGGHDLYRGGAGLDTLRLDLTGAVWYGNPGVQQDILNYGDFLARLTHNAHGEVGNREFRFSSFDLRASQIEKVMVTVDGTEFTARITGDTTGTVKEDDATQASASGNLALLDIDPAGRTFQAVDPSDLQGTYGTFTFNRVTGDWGYTIDNSLPAVQSLNTTPAHDTLEVLSGDGSVSQVIDITVEGTNDAPTDITLISAGIPEDSRGFIEIGKVLVADADAGDTHSFSWVGATGLFIAPDGTLTGDDEKFGVIDHETRPEVQVEITATDAAGQSVTRTVTIHVLDVNEAPADITLSSAVVNENAPGALIGTLDTVDEDAPDTHTYTVSDARFEVEGDVLKLKDGESLDHETAPQVLIDVTSHDQGDLTVTKTFTIDVSNVNEAPTDIALSGSRQVREASPGNFLGTLSTTDPDVGDTHTYMVSDDRFEAQGNALKLKDGVSLLYDEAAQVTIDVTASDADGAQLTRPFTINVLNVFEAPIVVSNIVTITNTAFITDLIPIPLGPNVSDPDDGELSFTFDYPTDVLLLEFDTDTQEIEIHSLDRDPAALIEKLIADPIEIDVTVTDPDLLFVEFKINFDFN